MLHLLHCTNLQDCEYHKRNVNIEFRIVSLVKTTSVTDGQQKGLVTYYSAAYMSQTCNQKCFTLSEWVAAHAFTSHSVNINDHLQIITVTLLLLLLSIIIDINIIINIKIAEFTKCLGSKDQLHKLQLCNYY